MQAAGVEPFMHMNQTVSFPCRLIEELDRRRGDKSRAHHIRKALEAYLLTLQAAMGSSSRPIEVSLEQHQELLSEQGV